jgi:hypothetical protein
LKTVIQTNFWKKKKTMQETATQTDISGDCWPAQYCWSATKFESSSDVADTQYSAEQVDAVAGGAGGIGYLYDIKIGKRWRVLYAVRVN